MPNMAGEEDTLATPSKEGAYMRGARAPFSPR